MHKEQKNNIKKMIIEIVGILVGSFVMATGVALFLLPNQLSSGGVSGLATVVYYLLNIPMGTTILAINAPLFLFAVFKIGKKFFVKSLIGTVSLSIFIDLIDQLEPLTNDRFLACIYGRIIIGLRNSNYISMSRVIILMDIGIVGLNVIFFREIEIGLYSAIAIYLMGKMIDIVFEGIYFTKLLFIISDKNEEIAKKIGEKIKRGTTGIFGKGMYTGENKLILLCAVTRRDIERIKMAARKIDPKSFIIITNSREVVGLGFKKV